MELTGRRPLAMTILISPKHVKFVASPAAVVKASSFLGCTGDLSVDKQITVLLPSLLCSVGWADWSHNRPKWI